MIRVERGEKKYKGDRSLLTNVDCNFHSGNLYALTGPSGIGKSTMLDCLAKLNYFTSGDIWVEDINLDDIKPLDYFRNYLGYLFQNYALIEEDSVQRNLNISRHFPKQDLVSALDHFSLDESYLKRKVFTLSGGEAQRVALARLYLKNPKIVLADEPTGALDFQNTQIVVQSLRHLADMDKIVIVATHDRFVAGQADQVIDVSQYSPH
ncbi:ATP-binding cassette domain-containing protein [Oenococcus sp. UCMA 17063]|nr:ATP-binding cassette domain-containing protein [Oenococcus sp. UCMA 17063]